MKILSDKINNNILFGLLIAGLGMLISPTIGVGAWLGATPGVGLTALVYYSDELRRNRKRGKIESELPTALREIASAIEGGISFRNAISGVSKKTEIGREFENVMKEVNSGVPVPVALDKSAKKVNSRSYSIAVNQLVLIYKSGKGIENLRRIASSIRESQGIEIKNFSGKMVMYSLLLIASSSILPSLFQAYLAIGSMFMDVQITKMEALLIPVIAFPVMNILIILAIQMKKPRFMVGRW